jgi:RNA polymerase sigma factor for flagellar operon FliA
VAKPIKQPPVSAPVVAAKVPANVTPIPRGPLTAKELAAEQQQLLNADLWARYVKKRDGKLREQLILQYAPLVKYVMGRLAISLPSILDYEDILSFGTIGLIEAVERFDPEKGVKFETYAISRIRGSIIDALRSLDRLPRSVRQRSKEADLAIITLTHSLGRDPSDEEVAESLTMSVDAYRRHMIDAAWVTVSLDANSSGGDEDDDSGAISVPDPDGQDVSVGMEQQELIGELGQAIRELPDREQLVLSLYYKDELTMREVSKVLGISESRVCQLHARALSRLRASISRIQGGQAA